MKWTLCRHRHKNHYLRNVAAAVPKQHAPAVLAVAKTIFSQPTAEAAREAVSNALHLYEPRFPKVAEQLRAAEADVLAYMTEVDLLLQRHRASQR